MSNAWHHYVGPLAISAVFVLVGIVSLCGYWFGGRNPDGTRRVGLANTIMGAVFGFAAGGPLGLYFLITSPTPWERERAYDHVFATPPERVERFVVKAGTMNPPLDLTRTDVVIDDPAHVQRIAERLRAAGPEVWANHPRTRWYANVEMVTRDGTFYFSVSATVPGDKNGTLVSPMSSERGKWHLGDVRADGLDVALEEALNSATSRTQ